MTCLSKTKRSWQKKLDRLDDSNLLSASRTNDAATAIRERKGIKGPHYRLWRRMIKQEMAKRGLGT